MSFRRFTSFKRQSKIINLTNINENDDGMNAAMDVKLDSIQDESLTQQYRQSLRIKEGANKIFSLSKNFYQKLDAAKAVLVADLKVKHLSQITNHYGKQKDLCYRAQVTISDIRIPLLWMDGQGNVVANGRYVIFCVVYTAQTDPTKHESSSPSLSLNHQETQLVCDIDHNTNDIILSDVMQFNNVNIESDKIIIELYGHAVMKSNISLRRKRLQRRSSFDQIAEENNIKTKVIYEKLGEVTLDLSSFLPEDEKTSDSNQVFSRRKLYGSSRLLSESIVGINRESNCDIPFFETLACQISLVPQSKIACLLAGTLNLSTLQIPMDTTPLSRSSSSMASLQLFEESSQPESSVCSNVISPVIETRDNGEYYCELSDSCLNCWRLSPALQACIHGNRTTDKKPLIHRCDVETADLLIPVTKNSAVSMVLPRQEPNMKYSLKLSTYFDDELRDFQEYILDLPDEKSAVKWHEILLRHIQEQKDWYHLFKDNSVENVPKPTSFLRQGSVYRAV